MRKRLQHTLALALFVFGVFVFSPPEARAGQQGSNVPPPCISRTEGIHPAERWCTIYGDWSYYCAKPESCNGKPVPVIPGTLTYPGGKGRKALPRISKAPAVQPETVFRQTYASLLSLLILAVGLAGVIWSGVKLLPPAFGSKSLGSRRLSYPRAAGFAGFVAVLCLASGAWLKSDGTKASGALPKRSQAQPAGTASEPQFSSAFQIGGAGLTQVRGTAVDGQGNTYVAGGFIGEITFDTTPQPTTLTSTEAYDVFVAKFDPAGKPLWARVANGATGLSFTDPDTNRTEEFSFDGALALALDAQGNAYVGGGFVKSLTFMDAAGNAVATLGDDAEAESDEINFELFVAKYDAAGSLVWARGGESGAPDDAEAEEDLDSGINGITEIVVDKRGNPYVAGTFSGTNFLGQAVAPEGGRDVLLARLNPANGDPAWVSTPGSADTDAAMGLAVDDSANLYLIGDMGGTITFQTEPAPTTLAVEDEFRDSFVAKYSPTGEALWAKQIGGTQPIDGAHLAVNGAGQLYLTGAFEGEAEFDSINVTDPSAGSGSSGFLAKYTTDGNALWVRVFGRSAGEVSSDSDVAGYRVTVDRAGAPYVSGVFRQEATFGRETPATRRTLQSERLEDQFVAHYDAAGNFQWVKQPVEGGEDSAVSFGNEDVPVEVLPLGLAYNDAANAILLAADFRGTLTLDAVTLDSGPGRHAYVATLPLGQAAASSSTVQFSSAGYTVGEGAGGIQITVTRSGDVSAAASVDYAVSDGTASQKGDYEITLGTLRFAPGETGKTFRVLVVNDASQEGAETINLTLSDPVATALGAPSAASVTIRDDDAQNSAANPLDGSRFFVRQHYLDFLGREPDPSGLAFWVGGIESCGTDQQCREVRRVNTSAAFFLAIEFQETGFYVIRAHRVAFGGRSEAASSRLSYQQFIRRARQVGEEVVVGQAGWEQRLDSNKQAYAELVASTPEFAARFPVSQSAADYVGALYASAGVQPSEAERQEAIGVFGAGGVAGRAAALRKVADSESVRRAEFNPAFVLMEYFGYLRRNPVDPPDADDSGYQFWLGKLNRAGGDFIQAEMVKAFINSDEYRQRFGQ